MGQRDRVIEKLANKVDLVADRVDLMAGRVERIAEQLDRTAEQQDRVVQKLVELDDYVRTEVATKNELTSVKDELLLHIDGQAKKQETFDQEIAVLRYRMDTIEKK